MLFHHFSKAPSFPSDVFFFKVNNGNTKTISEVCSKTQERRHWSRFEVFIINFEQISRIVQLLLFLTLNK